MPIDAYSLCPGGTGKKIKFCCPDFLGELETVQRMLDGEQYLACLAHVENLLTKHPDKACLLAWRSSLLRATHQEEKAQSALADFLTRHPANPIALGEKALRTAAEGDPLGALGLIQEAIAAADNVLSTTLYEDLLAVAQSLVMAGYLPTARAWLITLARLVSEDSRPDEWLSQLDHSSAIPVWAKGEWPLGEVSADAPWKAGLDEAIGPAKRMQWSEASRRLAALAEQWPNEPIVWRALAAAQIRVADEAGAAQSLRRIAALEGPLDDRVEALALAMYLQDDPLGDELPEWNLTYEVADPDALAESLAGSRQLVGATPDTTRWPTEEGPPPMRLFAVLDRPSVDSPDAAAVELPRVIGQLLLFGRQTDRPARIELLQVSDADRPAAETLLLQLGGTALGALVEETREGQSSRTRQMLTPRWRLPPGLGRDRLRALFEAHHEDAIFVQWPSLPLGCLDGRTPREAAADPSATVAVLAAVMYLEYFARGVGIRPDMDRLRRQLGLPELGTIDPVTTPLGQIPLWRRHRIDMAKLADRDVLEGFQSAAIEGADAALEEFARAIVERPSLENDPSRLDAYSVLVRSVSDPQQATAWIDRARQEIDRTGKSNAAIDLMELALHLQNQDVQGASRTMAHLQSQHLREPGVGAAVQSLLVQAGVLRPDGMPTAAAARAAATASAAPAAVPAAEEPPSNELWVPDGAKPAAGEKSKLWVPGMD